MNYSAASGAKPSMRLRANIKTKRCAHCDRTFTKEEHLKRHERSHTGEKPFKCQKCHKRYARSDVLARHIQTHTDENVDNWPRRSPVEYFPTQTSPTLTGISGQWSRACDKNQQSRNGLFVPEHYGLAVSHNELDTAMLLSDSRQSGDRHQQLVPTPHSNGADDITAVVMSQTTQSCPARTRSEPESSEALLPEATQPWQGTTHEDATEARLQDRSPPAPLPKDSSQSRVVLHRTASNENTRAVPVLHNLQDTSSQPSLWQTVDNRGTAMSQSAGNEPSEHLFVHEPSQPTSTMHPSNNPTPSFQAAGSDRFESTEFMLDMDFGPYNYMSPGISDFLDFAAPRTPFSTTRGLSDVKGGSSETLFSVDQVQRMGQLWRGRRTISNVRMIRSMWRNGVQHEADNIFSKPRSPGLVHLELVLEPPRKSRWGIDDGCRERVRGFCKKLDDDGGGEDSANLTPRSMTEAPDSDTSYRSSSILFLADGFPTREILDASFDLFFQCCPLHFIHKATFDAKTIPEPLLLAIHLVGFSTLYPERSRVFVLRYQKALMRFCRTDLTSKVPGHCHTWEILVTIASTVLMVYLGLGHLEQVDADQPHMLCIQMLHIAEKYGLFAASNGDDPHSQLPAGPNNRDGSWKAWGRVESIKRMICCLLWMDMAYARIMSGAGVLDIERVEFYLPCDVTLFEAPTSTRFFQLAEHETQTKMPPISIQNVHADLPITLNHMATETLLVALYLQVAAIRHRTTIDHHQSYLAGSIIISDEEFSTDSKTSGVIASLLSLPSRSAKLFQQRHRVTAFAWNNVCIAVTADLNLLEIASGRDGIDAARTAMTAVTKWSRTARARRAVLHATQIFDILSSSRLSEWNIARPDLLLFQSGLVVSMYLFVCDYQEEDHDVAVFELLQSIDWIAVGHEGLAAPTQPTSTSPSLSRQCSLEAADSALNFIRNGGPMSFSGDVLVGGSVTARKILLAYVHLLDGIGKYRGSSYSQILKTMSDFVIEGNN